MSVASVFVRNKSFAIAAQWGKSEVQYILHQQLLNECMYILIISSFKNHYLRKIQSFQWQIVKPDRVYEEASPLGEIVNCVREKLAMQWL